MFYVYQLRADDEVAPFYIGKSFVGSKRLIEHLSECRNGGKTMKSCKIRSIQDRGACILEEVLFTFDTELEAHDKERELIAFYGRRDNRSGLLTNHTDGGEGIIGQVVSEETREKMSRAKIGNTINVGRIREDMVERFSKPITAFAFDGTVVGHYSSSKAASDDLGVSYKNISDVLVGKKFCAQTKTKIKYQFKFGTIVESIDLPTYNRGKGKVVQMTISGEIVDVYDNAKQASEATGISVAGIRSCVSGKAKTAGKFRWQSHPTG